MDWTELNYHLPSGSACTYSIVLKMYMYHSSKPECHELSYLNEGAFWIYVSRYFYFKASNDGALKCARLLLCSSLFIAPPPADATGLMQRDRWGPTLPNLLFNLQEAKTVEAGSLTRTDFHLSHAKCPIKILRASHAPWSHPFLMYLFRMTWTRFPNAHWAISKFKNSFS